MTKRPDEQLRDILTEITTMQEQLAMAQIAMLTSLIGMLAARGQFDAPKFREMMNRSIEAIYGDAPMPPHFVNLMAPVDAFAAKVPSSTTTKPTS